ncbi:hypothetical protein ACH427_20470 [Streptomyces sp. NPDC020379]|uniref:hypothetical protein n=1 Tax=Streptomyces sp. NPDC020379 TaxID=3365071 RepID=UPI0037875F39
MNGVDTVKAARRLSGLVAVGALALTGCGPDEKPAQPASSASSAPAAKPGAPTGAASTAGPGTSSAGTGSAGGSGSDAKSGDNLKLGQAAKIPFTYGSTKGEISLAVTSIDQGDPADLASLNLGDQVKGKVPYYIRYSVTNAGTTDLSYSAVNHMKGHLPDGTEAQDLMVIGDFDKCKSDALPSGFTGGKTAQGCAVALAPSSSVKVTSAEYWGEPFTLGKGVFWK